MKKAEFNKGVQGVLEGFEIKANQTKAGEIADAIFDLVYDLVVEGEEVPVGSLGKLTTSERAARKGRNPSTGEEIEIAASTVAKFKPSKALKDTLKSK